MFWLGVLTGWTFGMAAATLIMGFFMGASERMTEQEWREANEEKPTLRVVANHST